MPEVFDDEQTIVVSDAACCDCGGAVTLFAIPDKVWRGLGLTSEWVCLSCVARRLSPAITADELSEEIYRQRRRFRLKRINRYFGARLESCRCGDCKAGSRRSAQSEREQGHGSMKLERSTITDCPGRAMTCPCRSCGRPAGFLVTYWKRRKGGGRECIVQPRCAFHARRFAEARGLTLPAVTDASRAATRS